MPAIDETESAVAAQAVQAALEWLTDFVGRPHPDLGRSGAVCPFVKPALRASTLRMRVRATGPYPPPAELRELVRESVREFLALRWPTENRSLHSLAVLLPDLDPGYAWVLDDLHREMKDEVVRQRLMFAQFHPECEERSARNRGLRVAGAPVPMLVVRRMASHDIMFLGERPEWVAVYTAEFGHLYDNGTAVEPFLADCYRRAQARHRGVGA